MRRILLGPIWVLELILSPNTHIFQIWRFKDGKSQKISDSHPRMVANKVLCLTISGHGVIEKSVSSNLATRVRAESETFIWNERNEELFFVRRDRVREILEYLASEYIFPQNIFVGISPQQVYSDTLKMLKWHQFMYPTLEGSVLLQNLIRRICPLVLGIYFILLCTNLVLRPSVETQWQKLRTEFSTRKLQDEKLVATNTQIQTIQNSFLKLFHEWTYSVICDHIAAMVPEGVILTSLKIEPLVKRLEEGKFPERKENTVLIEGLASTAMDVSVFVEKLAQYKYFQKVQLLQLGYPQKKKNLSFQVEIHLL